MKIRYHILLLLIAIIATGCNKDEEILQKQTESLHKFITSTLGLVSQEEASEASGSRQPDFYTIHGSTVYRYITNYYDEDRREHRIVREGSLVQLTLSIYDFTGMKRITDTTIPLFSNDPEKIELLIEQGLNATYWPTEPYYIWVGSNDAIQGLAISLAGCYEGDEVQLYMTYPMAYGGDWLYTIGPESPLAIFFTVDVVFDQEN